MKSFSTAISRIGTESAFAVGPEIADTIKKGFDVVRLNIGEPGANIPVNGTVAAIASFKRHETHYMPTRGTDELLGETAEYLSVTRKTKFEKEDIVFCPGGKPVIPGAIMILTQPSDEVIYPTPGYPIYESMIDFVGAKKVPIALSEENGFKFEISDLEKLVNRRTKLLIINSPSNPTGGVLAMEDYEKIAYFAKKYDFYILSDESYARIAFSQNCVRVKWKGATIPITPSISSLPGMAERTIILDGFSKTYSMPGLRCGFAASKNREFMNRFLTFAINFWSCLPAPVMAAGLASLSGNQKEALSEVEKYREKRDIAVSMLNKIPGINCLSPEGAFYLFPNVTRVCKKMKLRSSEELRKYLLSFDKKGKRGVAVLSRRHFGKPLPNEREEYIRLSIAGNKNDVIEGIKRIAIAVS